MTEGLRTTPPGSLICPMCFNTGWAPRYTISRDLPAPAVIGTTGHLLALGPKHRCPNCVGRSEFVDE